MTKPARLSALLDDAKIVMPFGKHRGVPLCDMDPGYLTWVLRTAAKDPDGSLGAFAARHGDLIKATIQGAQKRAAEQMEVAYTLNDSQQIAADTIVRDLLENDDTHLYRLEGGAGYGKSFTVLDIVRRAALQGYQVQACATSYVATQVLSKQLALINVEAKTIASTIRLAKVEMEDQEEYEQTPETGEALRMLLGHKRLLVVDEYSMVQDEIADRMMEAAQTCGGKLLVVGDLKQLPPVKQNADSSFSRIPGAVTLTQPMRFGTDSDLYALEQVARFHPEGFADHDWSDSVEIVTHRTLDDLITRYVEDMRAAPQEDARMMFFRRADVVEANAQIRARRFGDDAVNPVVEDERLMVMSTADVVNEKTMEPVRFYSGQSFLVEAVTEATHMQIPCYAVDFTNGTRVHVVFAAGTSQVDSSKRGSDEYTARLASLRDEAVESGYWGEWRALKNAFLLVGYDYAMTVHRCQGQTVDRSYFSPGMLRQSGPMASKLLYVAATRAKKAVHMVQGGA